MNRASSGIFRRLVSQCEHLNAELLRLRAEVRPSLGVEVFRPVGGEPGDVSRFDLRPVVFNIPERAGSAKGNLYVVVEGRLCFRSEEFLRTKTLLTHDFQTRVGYFRRDTDSLTHVFGAHYDFAVNEIGHPVFHAQLKSFSRFAVHVRQQYHLDDSVSDRDCVGGLLKTVRLPIAQLDVFSLFLQLCADHLVHKKSGPEDLAAFNSLLRSTFCRGAAFRIPRLGSDEACKCYRARHWYPVIQ